MPKKVVHYECTFNSHSYGYGPLKFSTEEKALEHEECCEFNPKNKTCTTCTYGRFHNGFADADDGYECLIKKCICGEYMMFNCGHWEERNNK